MRTVRLDVGFARPGPAQPGDSRTERVVRRGLARRCPVGSPGCPVQLALLGEVHEAEIQAERPRDDFRAPCVQRRELLDEAGAQPWVVATPQADRRPPHALDEVQEVGALLLGDDLAEERAEEAHLGRKRVAGATGPEGDRLGADGLVRPGTGRRRRHATAPAAAGAPGAGCIEERPRPFRTRPVPVPQPIRPDSAPRLVS